ncbi:MAG: hypothetical protein J2P37_07075 [Ktedonobacteraceae bacterium]|nr:hypothetical protein [Ktedonobacteraceae bacterium]
MSRAPGDSPYRPTTETGEDGKGSDTAATVDLRKQTLSEQPTSEQGDGPRQGERDGGRSGDGLPLGEQAIKTIQDNLGRISSVIPEALYPLHLHGPESRANDPVYRGLKEGGELVQWLNNQFYYVPGYMGRDEARTLVQGIDRTLGAAERAMGESCSFDEREVEGFRKIIHPLMENIQHALEHPDPADSPPREKSELERPLEGAMRVYVEERAQRIGELLPWLQQGEIAGNALYASQEIRGFVEQCRESVGQLATLLERDDTSRLELLREALRMETSIQRLGNLSTHRSVLVETRLAVHTAERSYNYMLRALTRGEMPEVPEVEIAGRRVIDDDWTQAERQGISAVRPFSEHSSNAESIHEAAIALHEVAERAKGEYAMDWGPMRDIFLEARSAFARLGAMEDGPEKARLRTQFETAENRLLDTLLEQATAHPEAGRLLERIEQARDGRERWQALIGAIERLAPEEVYQHYRDHPDRAEWESWHGADLSEKELIGQRAHGKILEPQAATFYTLRMPDVPYPDDATRSLFKIYGAMLDLKRKADYPEDMDDARARIGKAIDYCTFVQKLGEHRPPDQYSELFRDNQRFSRDIARDILTLGHASSPQELHERMQQYLHGEWEVHLERNGRYLTVLPEFSHIEGERQFRLGVQPLDTRSPEFGETVDRYQGEFIYTIYRDRDSGESTSEVLPRQQDGELLTHAMRRYLGDYGGELHKVRATEPLAFWRAHAPEAIREGSGPLDGPTLMTFFTSPESLILRGMASREEIEALYLAAFEHVGRTAEQLFTSGPFVAFVQKHAPWSAHADDGSGHLHPREGGMDERYTEAGMKTLRELLLVQQGIWVPSMTYGSWRDPVLWRVPGQ